jgi:hypothetical protein
MQELSRSAYVGSTVDPSVDANGTMDGARDTRHLRTQGEQEPLVAEHA